MTAAGVVVRPAALGQLSRARVLTVSGVVFYALAFLVAYRISVVPRYAYFGLGDRTLGSLGIGALVLMAAIPACWVPVRLERPSLILYWSLYLLVYIPALFLSFFSVLPRLGESDAILLDLTMLAGLLMIGLAYHVPVLHLRRPRLSAFTARTVLVVSAVVLFTVLLVQVGSILKFNALTKVQGQRQAFFAAIGGSFGPYAFAWLATVIDPLLIAIGIGRRRPLLVVGGLVGQVVLFTAAGAKGVLLSVPMFPALALLLRWRNRAFGGRMAASIGVLAAFAPVGELIGATFVSAGITFLILFRTLGIPGLAVAQYFSFFQGHPHTMGSHITGLSWLLQYPYARTIDYTVGEYYYNSSLMGLNANLWAGDGLASLGLPGILVISAFCAVVFWVLDTAAEGLDIRFTVLALGYGVVNFSNVSLFTNLLSGGIGFLIVVFWVWPRGGEWVRDG